MMREDLRLECLKLADRNGRELAQVLATAKAYEDFILKHEDKSEGDGSVKNKKLNRSEAQIKR